MAKLWPSQTEESESTQSGDATPWTRDKAFSLLNLACNLVVLNLLWLVCSLPLVTMGAASSAACAVAIRLARREDIPLAKRFFHHFKQSFGQATLLWLLAVAVCGAGLFDLYYAFRLATGNLGLVFAVVGVVVLLLEAVVCVFAWPLEARYNNTLVGTLRNALALARLYPTSLLALLALWFAPTGLCLYYWQELLIPLGWVWVIGGFGLLFYGSAKICLPVFEAVDAKQTAQAAQNAANPEEQQSSESDR